MQLDKSRTRRRGRQHAQFLELSRNGERYDTCTKMDLKLRVMNGMDYIEVVEYRYQSWTQPSGILKDEQFLNQLSANWLIKDSISWT